MKKGTSKKGNKPLSKTSNLKGAKKPCRTSIALMKADMESCAAADKQLEKTGIKKPKLDIYKDDPCYGCKFALENKDISGPFDRRFKCNGYPRIVNELKQAIDIVWKCGIGNQKFISSMLSFPISEYGHVSEAEVVKHLLHAQNTILCAASLIGERVENGKLECIETGGKPSCFVGANLDEYLTAK